MPLKGLEAAYKMIGFGVMIFLMALALSSIWPQEIAALPLSVSALQKQEQDLQDKLIQTEVEKYLGTPYRRGGNTRKGMDCSGFVRRIYEDLFGVNLPFQARYQYHSDLFEKVPPENLKTGDLLFFTATKNKKRINHVGIYLNDGRFAHALNKSGVTISSISNPHWKSRFLDAKRLPLENNPSQDAFEEYNDTLEQDIDQKRLITIGFAGEEFFRRRSAYAPFTLGEPNLKGVLTPELTYTQAILGPSWALNLSAFRTFYLLERPENIYRKNPMGPGREISSETVDIIHRDGLRLSSDLRLSNYLQITPSLIYSPTDLYIENIFHPRLSLGIDLAFGSWYYDWPISMALNYSDLQSSGLRPALPGDEREIFDVSITYRHQLYPHFHLLFTGEYAEKYQMVQQENENSLNETKVGEQGFSIKLNITF